jgi:hypothetical protein
MTASLYDSPRRRSAASRFTFAAVSQEEVFAAAVAFRRGLDGAVGAGGYGDAVRGRNSGLQ